MRTMAIRSMASHFEHKLFLSATPHNGYRESFAALLELPDNQRFARAVTPDRTQLDAVMVRRMKSELKLRWDGSRRFAERVVGHMGLAGAGPANQHGVALLGDESAAGEAARTSVSLMGVPSNWKSFLRSLAGAAAWRW